MINEFENYKRAVFSFRVAKDRLPGDLNNDGYMGWCGGTMCPHLKNDGGGESYDISSFPAPYNTKISAVSVAPFIDLYLENIVSFKPDVNLYDKEIFNKTLPSLNGFADSFFTFHIFENYLPNSEQEFLKNIPYGTLWIGTSSSNLNGEKLSKVFMKVDKKIDDENGLTGTVRYRCGNDQTSEVCDRLFFEVMKIR